MAYASIDQLRNYLEQVPAEAEVAGTDDKLEEVLDRATGIIRDALRAEIGDVTFDFAAWPSASTKDVRAQRGPYLVLPAHQLASVTAVALNGSAIASTLWEELDDGTLYYVNSAGHELDWGRYRYTVTAVWGYGPASDFDSIVELTLELAVNIWQSKQEGRFTNVVGVEGSGAVGYEGALTPLQRAIIQRVARRFRPVMV